MMKKTLSILASALLFVAGSLEAKVTLPAVIGDNMVLQQQTDAALWGTAEPGKKVSVKVSWAKKAITTTADAETGKWMVRVSTPAAGGPYEITISDGESITLKDVLIGEVWFASGQSNMEMPVKGYGSQPAIGGMETIVSAKASTPIRVCNIKQQSSTTVMESCEGTWQKNTPDAVAGTSATAYFFAQTLQQAIDVPVGIIVSAWGGSSIETWIKRSVFEEQFPEVDLGHLDGKKAIRRKHQDPCLLYNGQVAPLVPYTIKGMIWYQGCANRAWPRKYVDYQAAYVKMMREEFCAPDAPFYLVQIAPYTYDNGRKMHNGYFNEAQQDAVAIIPHCGMVTTCDIGEYGTIHPSHKKEVGQRLAYLAMQHDYGFDSIVADPPTFKSVEFKDGKAHVKFNVDRLNLSPMGADITGFEMAGADRIFHPAVGRLNSKDCSIVDVTCSEVAEPVAVRYCFRNWCVGNLYNNYGIPAAPFRTDDWDINTLQL